MITILIEMRPKIVQEHGRSLDISRISGGEWSWPGRYVCGTYMWEKLLQLYRLHIHLKFDFYNS